MSGSFDRLVDPRDLLEILRQHPLATPFNLTFSSSAHTQEELSKEIHTICPAAGNENPCREDCHRIWQECITQAIETKLPQVRACPRGFICFAIPLPGNQYPCECLIGGGVIDSRVNDAGNMKKTANDIPAKTLGEAVSLPQLTTIPEVEAASREIAHKLPDLVKKEVHTLSLNRTTKRLEAIQKLSRDIAECSQAEQAVEIVNEALIVLFNLPKVLLVLQKPGKSMTIHSTLGLEPDSFNVEQEYLTDFLFNTPLHFKELDKDEIDKFFTGLDTSSAYLFPLHTDKICLGTIVILDIDLHSRDLALIELLIKGLATRLGTLNAAEKNLQERQYSARLVSMISSLSLVNSREELYKQILEMSAELLTATSGSLMLLNEEDGTLKIKAAKGMTSSLAKTMTVAFGEGISGKVAKSGFPMLVNDIERDKRVASRNRPRFKTKSFISLPLETEKRLIGVLNLADKGNGENFSEADLRLVQTFTNHAVLMIDRAATLEKAGKFELLAITDPLTGLYNRRFLEERLQEELSRSERQQLSFSVILADLDSFKIYNDICGHLAGDNVLRKTAKLMRNSAREMDVVTRYGGEEFCLILPSIGKKESVFVGERIRRAIEVENFPGESHLPLGRLTTSVGIASFPTDGVTANELIHAADLALYRAKTLGRNRLVQYDPSMEKQSIHLHQE